MKPSTINLPLHSGHPPYYLIKRMTKLADEIIKLYIQEYGTLEFLNRISDPLWFQSFGCVLGFDWHSSGVTTVLSGVLKKVINPEKHNLAMSGGKGKNSANPKNEIPLLSEKYFNLNSNKINDLVYYDRMAAKVDNCLIQDGFDLYHHAIIFDKDGNWTIFQQGMNTTSKMARRYHWISKQTDFINEPHSGIISENKISSVLNLTSKYSEKNRKISVDISKEGENKIRRYLQEIKNIENREPNLDKWLISSDTKTNNFYMPKQIDYELPRHINWKIFKKIYDINPTYYTDLINIPGVGQSTIRALSLIAELIYGEYASWKDPIKYTFAHGGKDGVPFPVDRKTYDESINFLSDIIKDCKVERDEKIKMMKNLSKIQKTIYTNLQD